MMKRGLCIKSVPRGVKMIYGIKKRKPGKKADKLIMIKEIG